MGDMEAVGMRAVAAHQQPARQARADEVEARAGHGHRQLRQRDIQIAIEQPAQGAARRQLALEVQGLDAPGRAGAQHQRLPRRARNAQCERRTQHAFAPDQADLEPRMAVHTRHQRDEAVDRKVDVARRLPVFAQHLRGHQRNLVAGGQQVHSLAARQQFDQVIFVGGQGGLGQLAEPCDEQADIDTRGRGHRRCCAQLASPARSSPCSSVHSSEKFVIQGLGHRHAGQTT